MLKYEYFRNARGQQLRYATSDSTDAKVLVLLLPGRTEFIEKYQETVENLQRRGCAVAIIDWIDHGLSDRSLPDRLKCHATDFADYVDDLTFWVERVLPATFPTILKRVGIGVSMGGHIGFRAALEYPKLFNALALAAPMFGIAALKDLGQMGAQVLTGVLNGLIAERSISLTGDESCKARGNAGDGTFSHDANRDAVHLNLYRENPRLRCGDPTFGWAHAANQSCIKIMRADLSKLTTPVLLAIAGGDTIVDNTASALIGQRIQGCDIVTISGAGHEILMETDALQKPFWQGFDRLLERTI